MIDVRKSKRSDIIKSPTEIILATLPGVLMWIPF